jgi:hypothetical protein
MDLRGIREVAAGEAFLLAREMRPDRKRLLSTVLISF